MKIVINGFVTGLLLQFAMGPVLFFVIYLAMQRTLMDAWLAVTAVTLVDYFYIVPAIFGVGKLLEKIKFRSALVVFSSVVLVLFGIYMISGGFSVHLSSIDHVKPAYGSSFVSAFFLTMSSPLTIIFWAGIFTAKALEYNYKKTELIFFGVAAGLATPVFLGLFVTGAFFFKKSIPEIIVQRSNIIVGVLLILYGVISSMKNLRSNARSSS